MSNIPEIVTELKKNYLKGVLRDTGKRIEQLRALNDLLVNESDVLLEALYMDLRKPKTEAYSTEIGVIHNAIHFAISELEDFLQEKPVDLKELKVMLDMKGKIRRAPLGVVLVIAPWNYPIQSALHPLVGAIAGGNTVVVKPSEVSSNCSAVISRLVKKYMDPRVIQVVEGAVPETTRLLEQPFDMIFFIGSTAVGKIVYQAAAKLMVNLYVYSDTSRFQLF